MEFSRLLEAPPRSFFLFGPRGVGKSTWLRQRLSQPQFFDLLESRLYRELSQDPSRLEALVDPKAAWIVLDEIQKIPELLDEVHRLIEKRKWKFALSGSSARKLKKGGANLLGGRALTLTMETLTSAEIGGGDFDSLIERGGLPLVINEPELAAETLEAYVHTYLREEIQQEGLIRKTEPFIRFLQIAGTLNGQVVNRLNLSREASVPRATLDVYFSILEDTLIGHHLPAYRPGAKVREAAHPKFYFFDPGVARAAAGYGLQPADSVWKGFALETWLYHELRVWNSVFKKGAHFFYYKTGADGEIDFVLERSRKTVSKKAEIDLIEVKNSTTWDRRWEAGARRFKESGVAKVHGMWGIYRGDRRYDFDGFKVYPVEDFCRMLGKNEL